MPQKQLKASKKSQKGRVALQKKEIRLKIFTDFSFKYREDYR